jgi:hypothetical protein
VRAHVAHTARITSFGWRVKVGQRARKGISPADNLSAGPIATFEERRA